jgi:MFS family permease
MQTLGMGYYAYELTGSEAALGSIVATIGIPGLALSLFGGALGDRLEKKTVIQVCQALLAVLGLAIAVSIDLGVESFAYLIAISLVHGSVFAIYWPVRQALIPQVVEKDLVMNAVALNSFAMSTMIVIGPALGGVVIALLGVESLFYLLAALHAGAAVLVARLPKQRDASKEKGSPILHEIAEGIRYVGANSVVLLLLLLGFAQLTMMVPLRFIMPIFARDVFDTGPEGLGLLMSAMGFGTLGGSLFIASLGKVERRGLLLATTGVLSGALVLAFCVMGYLVPSLILGMVLLTLIGITQSGRMSMQNSLSMEYVDPDYRGRVMSIHGVGWSVMPVAVLPLTLLMAEVGAPMGMGVIAATFIAVSVVIPLMSPRIRGLQ